MVEAPGTAPGSDPLITSAFMFIVPKDTLQIGRSARWCKGNCQKARKFRISFKYVFAYAGFHRSTIGFCNLPRINNALSERVCIIGKC